MDFPDWNRHYLKILSDFGYNRKEDERAARVLSRLMRGKKKATRAELGKILRGEDVVVFGGAVPRVEKFIRKNGAAGTRFPVIAADGITSVLLQHGIVPDIVVTDLDGCIPDLHEAGKKGAIMVIHAHGDNIPALEREVPLFYGKVFGTTQAEPVANVHNFGGFTDGDRCVFLATHFVASSVTLAGFDFRCPSGETDPVKRKTKLRKLRWAERLISILENECDIRRVE
jgi:hypothetical protein